MQSKSKNQENGGFFAIWRIFILDPPTFHFFYKILMLAKRIFLEEDYETDTYA